MTRFTTKDQKCRLARIYLISAAVFAVALGMGSGHVMAGKDDPCKGPPSQRPPELCGGGSGGADETDVSCQEVFGVSGCDCRFDKHLEVSSGTPPGIAWHLTNDCETDATLVIPWFNRVTSQDQFTITAVINADTGRFDGSSVIAVEGHRAEFTESHVVLAADVDAGCDDGQLNSVVQFLLNDNSPDPINGEPDWWDEDRWWSWNSYPTIWWVVRGNTIEVESTSPPCQLIEAGRVPGEYDYATRGRFNVQDNVTTAAYEDAAIWLHDIGPGGSNIPSGVSGNTIGPASGVSADAVAVVIGPFKGDVEVSQNEITLEDGTGIMVLWGDEASNASVHHNDVMGGYRGVVVDSSVSNVSVNSNTLSGDNSDDSQGVCSDAASDRIRANKIRNYETKVKRGGCF